MNQVENLSSWWSSELEQRRQRAELRSHANLKAHTVRSASQAGRFALKVGKRLMK